MTREVTGVTYVGSPAPNQRGAAQVSGQVQYTDDYVFPRQLYAHFVRSPYASATIKSIDLSGARRVHGVVIAMDGEEVSGLIGPVGNPFLPSGIGGKDVSIYSLARDYVTFEGQAVAVIVAEDKDTAAQAAARVKVEYEVRRPAITLEEALAPDAPHVIPEWDSNVMVSLALADGDSDGAFGSAAHVVKANIAVHRHSAQPMETRAYNAVWDGEDKMVTLYAATQAPHPLRYLLAESLRLPENRVRVIAPLNGGAFGYKMYSHTEEPLLCLLAMKTRRPVKWVETREECLMTGSREQQHSIEIAFSEDGRMLAVRDRIRANVGAPAPNLGWPMAVVTMMTLPGPYDVSNVDLGLEVVVTNKGPWNPLRGYGKEGAAIALEFAMDRAARQLGIDPVELRMRNFIDSDQFPNKRPTGQVFDSGDYSGALSKAVEAIDYAGMRAKQNQLRREGRYLGIGIAYEVCPEGGGFPATLTIGYDASTVKVDASGQVTVSTGVTDPGTGNATGIAQMVADELGVAIEDVRVVQGDTERCPFGGGNFSSRSLCLGGAAAVTAARQIRDTLGKVAAKLLEVSDEEVRFVDGRFVAESTDNSVTLREASWAAYTHNNDAIGSMVTPPLEVTATCRADALNHNPDEKGRISNFNTFANGAYIVIVEVDPETGSVTPLSSTAAHDCGKTINPLLVEGQLNGSLAMALGAMLSEEQCYSETGGMTTRGFADYVMLRALDVPPLTLISHDSPSPHTPHGAKGAGESGAGGFSIALVNAVNDALAPLGAELTEFPVSAPNVWKAIQKGKQAHKGGGES
ncbi:xanthine dehydrogenase family protein molybdopterin-binding subunit [Paraburkholderia sp. 40]|uniref:xanthine dehydrogenase family protein molybdopterin-binding subunit n=1 Tax=Paraburkholderia sp. 40 TaxID=2991059 RepID=UPI003D21E609